MACQPVKNIIRAKDEGAADQNTLTQWFKKFYLQEPWQSGKDQVGLEP